MISKKGPIKQLRGPFVAVVELFAPNKRRRDCDNHLKAVIDYAVRIGLVEDDSLMQWCAAGWTTEDRAPYGAVLHLYSWDKKDGLSELAGLIGELAV